MNLDVYKMSLKPMMMNQDRLTNSMIMLRMNRSMMNRNYSTQSVIMIEMIVAMNVDLRSNLMILNQVMRNDDSNVENVKM